MSEVFDTLSSVWKTATDSGRQMLKVFYKGTGATDEAADRLLRRPLQVNKMLNKFGKLRNSIGEATDNIARSNLPKYRRMLKEAPGEFSREFKRRQGVLLNSPNISNFRGDVKGFTTEYANQLKLLNLVENVPGSKALRVKESGLRDVVFDSDSNELFFKVVRGRIKNNLNKINSILVDETENKTGRAAAKQVLDLRRSVDDIIFEATSSNRKLTPQVIQEAAPGLSKLRNELAETFSKDARVGSLYNNMNEYWTSNLDFMTEANRIIRSKNFSKSSESSLKKILNRKSGIDTFEDDLLKKVASVSNRIADKDDILDAHAATDFLQRFPKLTTKGLLIKGGALALGPLGKAVSAASLLAQSPRLVARGTGAAALGAQTTARAVVSAPGAAATIKSIRDNIQALPLKDKQNLLLNESSLLNTLSPALAGQVQQQ